MEEPERLRMMEDLYGSSKPVGDLVFKIFRMSDQQEEENQMIVEEESVSEKTVVVEGDRVKNNYVFSQSKVVQIGNKKRVQPGKLMTETEKEKMEGLKNTEIKQVQIIKKVTTEEGKNGISFVNSNLNLNLNRSGNNLNIKPLLLNRPIVRHRKQISTPLPLLSNKPSSYSLSPSRHL